jgi:hypothetical protein
MMKNRVPKDDGTNKPKEQNLTSFYCRVGTTKGIAGPIFGFLVVMTFFLERRTRGIREPQKCFRKNERTFGSTLRCIFSNEARDIIV